MILKNRKAKIIVITIAIILLALGAYLTLIENIGIIFFIVPLELIILPWLFTKGNWEKNMKKENAKKWKKSLIFNIYLILLILNLILELYLLVNRPPSLSHEPLNYLNSLANLNFVFVTLVNLIFMSFSLWKKSPKQILSLPLISFLSTFIVPEILIVVGLFGKPLFSLTFILLPVAQIIWALYIRFVFLRSDNERR